MFWVLNLLVSGRFLSAYGSGGLVSQPSKEAEGGAGRRWISGAVCCIDQCIKIPPSTVFQDLACHLVTDFAIRSLCLSCTLRNPTDLGRALLLLSPSEELPGWLAQSVLFRIDPSNTSVSKLWKSGTHLCQWPHSSSFPPAFVRQRRMLSSECLWHVTMQWDIPSQ